MDNIRNNGEGIRLPKKKVQKLINFDDLTEEEKKEIEEIENAPYDEQDNS